MMDINKNKFKIYGKFKMLECIVDISEEGTKVISTCQDKAQKCAKYLYGEGFVDDDENIELELR
jgi:hypothetical protein